MFKILKQTLFILKIILLTLSQGKKIFQQKKLTDRQGEMSDFNWTFDKK